MSSVESRIVTMKFENSQFESGVSRTLDTLARLKDSLATSFSGGSGLSAIGSQASGAQGGLATMGGAVEGISAKFVALSTIAITALSQISSAAFRTGADMVKSMSGVEAMSAGWSDYELKIGATQTIMAGTGADIGQVTKELKELDIYADKTIYSLSDMVSNIGKFTNAGVKLPVAVDALKGVAQVAALSGANSNEAARAMYNLGQAIGQGKVRMMDWKSVELANMGTKEFKEQLIDSALAMGTLKKQADGTVTTMNGTEVTFKTFATTLSEDWLTAEALTKTLARYADETTRIGAKATAAAQNVKTFSMMMETLRAAAGTGWTDTFETVIGNLPQATKLWTGLTNEIGGFIGRSADARNEMLKDWAKLGGRKDLIQSIKNVWEGLGSVLGPIKDAFREIFPRTTGAQLADMTAKLEAFTSKLRLSPEAGEALKRTFKGLFAVIHIFTTIISKAIGFVFSLFSAFEGGDGGILSVTASIGDMLVAFDEWLTTSKDVQKFFGAIGDIARAVIIPVIGTMMRFYDALGLLLQGDFDAFGNKFGEIFSFIGDSVAGLFDTFGAFGDLFGSFGGVIGNVIQGINDGFQTISNTFSNLGETLSSISGYLDSIGLTGFADSVRDMSSGVENLSNEAKGLGVFKVIGLGIAAAFYGAYKAIGPVVSGIGEILGALKDFTVRLLQTSDGTDALAAANTGVFIAMYLTIKKYAEAATNLVNNFGGTFASIRGTFDQLTGTLKTMQQEVQSKIILNIAIAVALLAASLIGLALVPMDKMAAGLGAIAGLFTTLIGAFVLLSKGGIESGIAPKLLAVSVAMIGMATAVTILSAAMLILQHVDLETIGKMALVLTALVAGAIALGYAGPLAILGAAALLVLAPAMGMMAGVLALYSTLDWGTVIGGIAKLGLTLVVLSAGLAAMALALPGAVAMLIAVPALAALAGVLAILGNLDMKTIGVGLGAMGAMLGILAFGLTSMIAAMPGAGALLVAAVALQVIIEPLERLGALDTGTLIKIGLALGGLFAILGLAALVLTPVIPAIFALAAALTLLGTAMLFAGVGMFAFASAFALLAATGTAGTAVLTATIIALAGLIPLIAQQIGLGIVAIAKVIAEAGPTLISAFKTVLLAMLRAGIELQPQFREFIIAVITTFVEVIGARHDAMGRAFYQLLSTGLKVIRSLFPDLVATGIAAIVAFLEGLARATPRIVQRATLLVTTFMRELGKNASTMAKGAAQMIVDFLNGLADAIREKSDEFFDAGENIADAIIDGLIDGLTEYGAKAVQKAKDIASDVIDGLGDAAGKIFGNPSKYSHFIGTMIDQGLIDGMDAESKRTVESASRLGASTVDALRNSMKRVKDVVDDEVSLDPTITPILDLTNLQNESSRINGMLSASPLSVDTTARQANALLSLRQSMAEQSEEGSDGKRDISFTQINNSPEALPAARIYRENRNLLNMAAERLGIE